ADRGPVGARRLASRPRVPRRPPAHGVALLHQLGGAALHSGGAVGGGRVRAVRRAVRAGGGRGGRAGARALAAAARRAAGPGYISPDALRDAARARVGGGMPAAAAAARGARRRAAGPGAARRSRLERRPGGAGAAGGERAQRGGVLAPCRGHAERGRPRPGARRPALLHGAGGAGARRQRLPLRLRAGGSRRARAHSHRGVRRRRAARRAARVLRSAGRLDRGATAHHHLTAVPGPSPDLVLAGGDVLLRGDGVWRAARADVAVRDGWITAVGTVAGTWEAGGGPAAGPGPRVRDCRGCLVVPGLIQAHVHLCQTLFRGLAD